MGFVANLLGDVAHRRAGAPQKRFYNAALPSRLNSGWPMLPVPTDWIIRTALRRLRARSRDQVENNDYAKRFVMLAVSNIEGPKGIIMRPHVHNPNNGQLDTLVNDAIGCWWQNWEERDNCDIAGRMNWSEHQRLFMRTVVVDGESLIRIFRNRTLGPHGFALQHLDPELLDPYYRRQLMNGTYIEQGIEFNLQGRPVAYHLMQMEPGFETYTYGGTHYIRVPASDIIHSFLPERVDQKRGLPWMSTSLDTLKMLDGYEQAALVAARVGAAQMGVITTPTGEDFQGDDVNDDGSVVFDADPGTFRQLPEGQKLEKWDPKYPDGQFDPFTRRVLRRIASGFGVSYNTLANDLSSVNFSSIRQGTLEDREMWKMLQEWQISMLNRRVYNEWLRCQLMLGNLKIYPKKTKPDEAVVLQFADEDRYRNVRFQGRRWDWVDPQRDANAALAMLSNGLKSRSAIIRERGEDPESVWREMADERKKLSALGLDFLVDQHPDIKETI